MAEESLQGTDVDEIEVQKNYNKYEHKYPLDYPRYIKMKKDQAHNALKKKKNCFGNFNVSLFWEEKLMLLL